MVIAMGIPVAWLRLRSGSVWPAAILHASHNLFVQGFFDRVTVDKGVTHWLTSEFGAGLGIAFIITAWLFWRARGAITVPNNAASSAAAAFPPSGVVTAGR